MAPKSVKGNGRVTAKPIDPPKAKPKKKPAKKAKAPAGETTSVCYIRNLYGAAGGSRVDLAETRIHLEPRGQRGDMRLVTEDMRMDPVYQHNLGVLFEEVAIADGQDIIRKQAINQQHGPSTFDLLTNEYGEKYDPNTRATITAPFEQQGVVMGHVSEAGSGVGSREIGNIERRTVQPQTYFQEPVQQPVFNPDVVPQGCSIEQAEQFIQTPREERQVLVESWIRAQQEAEGYRNSLNVSVEPPRS